MISNDSRHENNSQLELADGAKCSKRFISKVLNLQEKIRLSHAFVSHSVFISPTTSSSFLKLFKSSSTELKYT